ncbi:MULTISPECIES: rhamnan synthesis F family protein [Thioclava]|uniref:Rhamnan synthesis F family protein n=2 Tax=Thioclava TaxID=285107 RepID=A0ABZ1DVT5_9RHOB|nr:rhamnan synthesis F family protein [Thioclava sp. FTW29]
MICDLQRSRKVHVIEGQQVATQDVVVLLVYQPKGILASTYWQLDWLAKQGLSVVLVSNTKISDADKAKLSPLTRLIVERPNIGYDFGGYREGVLQVLDRKMAPRNLYVMNDSMWFPLSEDSDVIDQSRAAPEDVWGLFVDLDWRHRKAGNHHRTHVQSYFFRFSQKVVQDPRFDRYWRKMSIVNDKRLVIKMRELKLANHFADLGFSVGGLHSWAEVRDFLINLDDEEMMDAILRLQCSVKRHDARIIQPLLERGDMTALQIRDALSDKIEATNLFVFSTALHPYVMRSLGFPFLKKQRVAEMIGARAKILELGLEAEFPPAIRDEVAVWDKN